MLFFKWLVIGIFLFIVCGIGISSYFNGIPYKKSDNDRVGVWFIDAGKFFD